MDIDAFNSRENVGLSTIDFDCNRYLLLLIDQGGGKRRAVGIRFRPHELLEKFAVLLDYIEYAGLNHFGTESD